MSTINIRGYIFNIIKKIKTRPGDNLYIEGRGLLVSPFVYITLPFDINEIFFRK